MDEQSWVESRLLEALKSVNSNAHAFPEALVEEFRKLMLGSLQEPKKPAEMDEIATLIVAANRGSK